MTIETDRLLLREYTPDDFDALYEILSDPETMQHYPAPYDEARTRRWIEWNLENYAQYGFGLWAVVLKETGEFIGDCGITIQNIDGEMLPEIGYHIHKKYWRKGFAKEAARAVRDWVFRNTDYDTVYSYMKYTNVGSWSTAIANGMKKVKEYPDPKNTISYAFAITREEWEKLQEGSNPDTEKKGGMILRCVTEDDLAETARTWPSDHRPVSEEEARGAIAYMRDNYARNTKGCIYHLCLAVCRADEPAMIMGWCGLDGRESHTEPEIFILLDEEYRGKGYGTQCVKELLRIAAEDYSLRSVHGGCDKANIASARAMEKGGMVQYGTEDNGDPLFRFSVKGEGES